MVKVKNIKSSVKIKNKAQNKLNKGKKRKSDQKKLNRSLTKVKSILNLTFLICYLKNRLFYQPKHENDYDDEQLEKQVFSKRIYDDEEGLAELAVNKNRRSQKRKKDDDSDDSDTLETNYKVKSSFIKNMNEQNRQIALALPIKTQTGALLKNIRTLDYEEDKKSEPVQQEKQEEIKKEETLKEEPKSVIELIREKRN